MRNLAPPNKMEENNLHGAKVDESKSWLQSLTYHNLPRINLPRVPVNDFYAFQQMQRADEIDRALEPVTHGELHEGAP